MAIGRSRLGRSKAHRCVFSGRTHDTQQMIERHLIAVDRFYFGLHCLANSRLFGVVFEPLDFQAASGQ